MNFSYWLMLFKQKKGVKSKIDTLSIRIDNVSILDLTPTSLFKRPKCRLIIGSADFINGIKAEVEYSTVSHEITDRKILRLTLDQIVKEVSNAFDIDAKEVKKSQRGITNNARAMTMLVARKYFGFKLHDIAEYFGVSSYQTVSKLYLSLSKKVNDNNQLSCLLTEVLENCKIGTPRA